MEKAAHQIHAQNSEDVVKERSYEKDLANRRDGFGQSHGNHSDAV
jgi:hypothetical protein